MSDMVEAFINDKDEWDFRPLENCPETLTVVVKINYDVADVIAFLREIDDPDLPPRAYTLDDLVQIVRDWAYEDISQVDGFYIETDDGKVVG